MGSAALMDPGRLYELGQRQRWDAAAIDFTRDRSDWLRLAPGHHERLLWHIGAFFVGEERVTAELGPLVAAHESAGEEAFLAAQQADEARHVELFSRFYEQVLGTGADRDRQLREARRQVSRPLSVLLDEELAAASRHLALDPQDPLAKVDFVTLYHMIVEGTLALTGQAMVLEFLDRRAILPGLRAGLRLVSRDEHRHIAYGTWLLREKAGDPGLRRRVSARLADLVPLAAGVLVPPDARARHFRPLDWDGVAVHGFAFRALARRLRQIGIELDALNVLAAGGEPPGVGRSSP